MFLYTTYQFVSLAAISPETIKNSKLSFKSPSDWEQMGVKKERWTKVAGVDGEVPIRHADRYAMPGVMVSSFIEKFVFEVDDLMPHRLRQIRINFNFNEDIAWECDINKAEGATDACLVYKRTPAGPNWTQFGGPVPHPVKKNGIFEFKPGEFYSDVGLGAIG